MTTWLAKRNATAKLLAATLLTAAVLTTVDPLVTAVAIAAELALLPFTGVPAGVLWRRGWPILASATGIFLFTVLLGAKDSPVLAHVAGLDVRENAAGYALRLVAVGLPGFIVFATIDPTDLADSLIAHLKVSPRFAIGALAAFRLVPLLADEYRLLGLARRARGIDAGWHPVRRLRLFFSTLFGLLVAAIRRGIRLATAMEARGFDRDTPRTTARPTRFGWSDALVVVVGVILAAVVIMLKFVHT
ncbi:energy-coupling factor transporter transmembrane component T [Dactylosporangium fulvum]|uniref:Energy-coupling factor transporter transmembrane protein EcfT n=1 Tax=Dactylosporangium fulvum TaxID=53359 RepID=A0ABY5VWD5_9ACTN|nr:energy-coupling factor transporter transmembrane component T [Dactylosporangium fulvum]UWP81426.1 energy-coupling factor transporter transmembrane protein EcfT [Dactylosporangium fulvum]